MPEEISCPTCGKAVALDRAHRPDAAPFCSRRCRLIDLGAWSDGAYAVGRPLGYDDIDILEDSQRSTEGRSP